MSEVKKSVDFLESKAKAFYVEADHNLQEAEACRQRASELSGKAECLERAAKFLRSESEKKAGVAVNHSEESVRQPVIRAKNEAAVSDRKKRAGPKNATSKYRGVSKNRKKWRATAYREKQNHYLGTFDDELEAAIAVADEEGRNEDADRIRKKFQGEIHKNVIDSTAKDLQQKGLAKKPLAHSDASGKPTIWECNKCCEPHETTGDRPEKCRDCGKDHGFTRVRDLTRGR